MKWCDYKRRRLIRRPICKGDKEERKLVDDDLEVVVELERGGRVLPSNICHFIYIHSSDD